jgi:hypothetical protein
MIIAFIFSALTVVYNVIMRRRESSGKNIRIERLDSILLWVYPLLYLGSVWMVFSVTS